MSDIEKFISERKASSPKAWADFDTEYQQYANAALMAHRGRHEAALDLARRQTFPAPSKGSAG